MKFELDPFQKEAIRWIEQEHSVFVSAPTGAGKTVIAEAAIEKALSRGEEVIYTAPIKALSNQKYRDFRALYGDRVGILTGDVSLNPDAPILIMTTEIYRNSLFENADRIRKIGWVIFDEIHYLDDVERGTVWEESLLFTPPGIRILALSATIPNVHELVEWIRSIHNRPIAVVQESHRPVPLHFLFQCQGRIIENIKRLFHEGYLNRGDWRLNPRERRRGFVPMRAKPNPLDMLLGHLRDKDRLPAIYFVFGRKRAESQAWEAVQFDFLSPAEKRQMLDLYRDLLERYDLTEEASAQEMRPLVEQGIAYHHAGMLPTLKEVIEQLFTSRLIKLIFTTETFALGINMPARTVIFDELEKFYGHSFQLLTTRDFYQMAGRAGRRGMDAEGFVYVRLHPRDIPYSGVERILFGKPEAVQSQLNTAYATLLNLYRQLGPRLLEIYPRTFHHYQSTAKGRRKGFDLLQSKLALLKEMGYLAENTLSAKGEFAASVFGYELPLAEMQAQGLLESLDEAGLAVLLSGLVFEPRKNDTPPRLGHHHEKLRRSAVEIYKSIYHYEGKHRIRPFTKPPHFHLAAGTEAWVRGASFEKLLQVCPADEGEIVRYFRMMIQLLRELLNAPHTSERLQASASSALHKINRGVVDAEKQLRV